jgi:hypothetical protein
MKLEAKTISVNELPRECIPRMQELMEAHYEGVSSPRFLADLFDKQWVILLYHENRLCGFSTQTLFDHLLQGRTFKILFSGDTVIEKNLWGSLALPVAWGRLMLSLQAAHPDAELYWLLTSKGYKTYRFLPVFFHQFHPCCAAETPALERELLQSVATRRFGKDFDAATGILRATPGAQRLRPGVADIDQKRLQDPNVAFFQKLNPGHAQGDELVCLARFHPDNLTPYIRRQL